MGFCRRDVFFDNLSLFYFRTYTEKTQGFVIFAIRYYNPRSTLYYILMPKKIIVITGTTSGIGTQAAIEMARPGNTVYMLVRNIAKGEKEKRNILVQVRNTDVHIIQCDLADMASVKQATAQLKTEIDHIDVLINNAGGIFPKREQSIDGFEMTLALNHLGPFLLTLGLMPLLEKGKARIINVSSEAHKAAKVNLDDLQWQQSYSSIKAYANSKLFNIYFAKSLAEKYAGSGITAYSLHPGVVNTKFGHAYTGFWRFLLDKVRPLMITPAEAATAIVYLASEPGIEGNSGQYFKKNIVTKPGPIAENDSLRQAVWERSEAMLKAWL